MFPSKVKSRQLIIGLDLSFSSSGISIAYLEDMTAKSICFHRLVYNKKPRPISNINQHTYYLPTNINYLDLIIEDEKEFYVEDQAIILLKSMVIAKRITKIIRESFDDKHGNIGVPLELYINIEGNIAGNNSAGSQQLRIDAGLKMLNGIVRSELIRYKIDAHIKDFKLYITSPTSLKIFFTGVGNADKAMMLTKFITFWDGTKILPDTSSLGQINDVIDAFALMMNMYYRINTQTNIFYERTEAKRLAKQRAKQRKREKTKTTTTESVDIYLQSIPDLPSFITHTD